MKSVVFLRRTEAKYAGNPVIDIPAEDLSMTLKLHPNWEVLNLREEKPDKPYLELGTKEIVDEPVASKMECPLCGDKFSTEKGLKTHKLKKHS